MVYCSERYPRCEDWWQKLHVNGSWCRLWFVPAANFRHTTHSNTCPSLHSVGVIGAEERGKPEVFAGFSRIPNLCGMGQLAFCWSGAIFSPQIGLWQLHGDHGDNPCEIRDHMGRKENFLRQ